MFTRNGINCRIKLFYVRYKSRFEKNWCSTAKSIQSNILWRQGIQGPHGSKFLNFWSGQLCRGPIDNCPWNPGEDHSHYNFMDVSLNENQLCAGLPSTTNLTLPFTGEYEEDFGGPLICLEKTTQKPIFTGIASSNSLSTKSGYPGKI